MWIASKTLYNNFNQPVNGSGNLFLLFLFPRFSINFARILFTYFFFHDVAYFDVAQNPSGLYGFLDQNFSLERAISSLSSKYPQLRSTIITREKIMQQTFKHLSRWHLSLCISSKMYPIKIRTAMQSHCKLTTMLISISSSLRIFLRTVATCSRPITKILLNFCYVNYANPQV